MPSRINYREPAISSHGSAVASLSLYSLHNWSKITDKLTFFHDENYTYYILLHLYIFYQQWIHFDSQEAWHAIRTVWTLCYNTKKIDIGLTFLGLKSRLLVIQFKTHTHTHSKLKTNLKPKFKTQIKTSENYCGKRASKGLGCREIIAANFAWISKQQVNLSLFLLDWYSRKFGLTHLLGHRGKVT